MKENHQLSAVCGLFCPSCSVFIGTTEDPERLARVAKKMGVSPAELSCRGCRSDTLSSHCRSCALKQCATFRELSFCHDCNDYPCEQLQKFQRERPHRNELFESGNHFRNQGLQSWWEKMEQDYSCSTCGTINSAYDLHCRSCGGDPSCPYVDRHGESIRNAMKPPASS